MTVCKVSCMFQSCAPAPDNTRSIKAQAPAEPEMRIMVKRKLTVGGLIGCLASVAHYHRFFFLSNPRRRKGKSFFAFPHAISFWNMIPGSLLLCFKLRPTSAETPPARTFTFPTKRYNVALSVRTTRVRVPLARNPSPLQHPTLYFQLFLR